MRVVVLYHESGHDATVEDRDVLVQRDAVSAALQRLGHATSSLGCTLNLAAAQQRLSAVAPDVVFNLVESLGGTDRLMALATMLLDALQIPYTGTQTDAILATSNKLAAKKHLLRAGLPTPAWFPSRAENSGAGRAMTRPWARGANNSRWILKPVLEHASLGMDDDAVVDADDLATLQDMLRTRELRNGRPHFAEQYVDGREFNLSMLNGQILPPAEIDFSSFPSEKPRIVGYQAKWDENSFEYQQTTRRFDFSVADRPLLNRISQLALACWRLFDLSGYARVDFRVDRLGQPWILEVNANPCLSPDAGFAAALLQAGLTYDDAIQRITDEAVEAASFSSGSVTAAASSDSLSPRT